MKKFLIAILLTQMGVLLAISQESPNQLVLGPQLHFMKANNNEVDFGIGTSIGVKMHDHVTVGLAYNFQYFKVRSEYYTNSFYEGHINSLLVFTRVENDIADRFTFYFEPHAGYGFNFDYLKDGI